MSTGTQKILDAAEALGFGAAKLAVPEDVADAIAASVDSNRAPDEVNDFEEDLDSSAERIGALADVLLMASWHGVVERRTLSAVADLMFNEGFRLLRAKDAALGLRQKS